MPLVSLAQPSRELSEASAGNAVTAAHPRGVDLRVESINGKTEVSVRVKADGTKLNVTTGRIGGLLRQREETVQPAIDDLDTFSSQLIFQINRVHSQGQGQVGYEKLTGTYDVADTSALTATDVKQD